MLARRDALPQGALRGQRRPRAHPFPPPNVVWLFPGPRALVVRGAIARLAVQRHPASACSMATHDGDDQRKRQTDAPNAGSWRVMLGLAV